MKVSVCLIEANSTLLEKRVMGSRFEKSFRTHSKISQGFEFMVFGSP